MTDTQKIDGLKEKLSIGCKKLRLSQAFADAAWELDGEESSMEFVTRLVWAEIERREVHRISKLTDKAHFPYRYEADQFDPSEVEFPAGMSYGSILELPFCSGEEHGNVVMFGKPGSGKTMFSIILGLTACHRGYPTLFFNTGDLLSQLKEAQEKDKLQEAIDRVKKARVVIIDEFAYLPMSMAETRLLFRLLSGLNGRASVIINTITEFSKWPEVFSDEKLAASIAGKIMQNSCLLLFRGRDRRFAVHH